MSSDDVAAEQASPTAAGFYRHRVPFYLRENPAVIQCICREQSPQHESPRSEGNPRPKEGCQSGYLLLQDVLQLSPCLSLSLSLFPRNTLLIIQYSYHGY